MAFKRTSRGDFAGGITTFFTMAYIVIVNPAILSSSGTGMPFAGVMTATVVLAFLMTLLMGLYAKLPYGVAPGMGVNAFFAYTLVLTQKIPWQTALGMVFWAGVIFLVISATPLREWIAKSIPRNLRVASATGIGIFLTFIGLKNCGIVVGDPDTLVKLGKLTSTTVASVAGLAMMIWLLRRKNPLAFLGGIFAVTALAIVCGWVKKPEHYFAMPDFRSTFMAMDVWGGLKLAYVPAIISILFTDLFDSISTFVGVSQATGLVDSKGNPKNLRQGLVVDSFATLFAGVFGTSSGTAFIESAAGIEVGGRSGRSAVITAFCFLPCLFLAPLAGMVPEFATGPVLIVVGALMFRSVQELNLRELEDVIPAFLTIVLIPLTFSITQGILWGFVSHSALYLLSGRGRELKAPVLLLSTVSLGLIILAALA